MTRAFDFGNISSQYIISMFCEPYEKVMLEGYHSKVLMSGMVPSLAHAKRANEIREEADELVHVFYDGN